MSRNLVRRIALSAGVAALVLPGIAGLTATAAHADPVTLVVSSIRFDVPKQARFLERIQEDPRVRIHVYEDRPFNFSWLNNTAAAALDGLFEHPARFVAYRC